MKIAICFSGSIRDFPTCLPSLKRYVLNNLNADIYLHLWEMNDISELDTDVRFKWREDACESTYVIEKLKPISYVINKYTKFWEEKIIRKSGIDLSKLINEKLKSYAINACSMYYKIYKCFRLMEKHAIKNNIEYDIIIRARLDFIWEDSILPTFFDNTQNTIYLIKDRYATHSKIIANDKFFAGNFIDMKKMCHLFWKIREYQNNLQVLEGQTLNEYHIKTMGFSVTWIGNKYTYYKCMGRHRIKNNNKFILVGNNNHFDDIFYEFSYFMLYRGYNIVYLNEPKEICHQLDILKLFQNFSFNKVVEPNKLLCYIGSEDFPLVCKKIIITKMPYDNNNTHYESNITYITINSNIKKESIVDFLISIIITDQYEGIYQFDGEFPIKNIDTNDDVICRYLDHGYYHSKIVGHEKNGNHLVKINNKIISLSRDNIKIINLIKYYQKINPSLLPTNK